MSLLITWLNLGLVHDSSRYAMQCKHTHTHATCKQLASQTLMHVLTTHTTFYVILCTIYHVIVTHDRYVRTTAERFYSSHVYTWSHANLVRCESRSVLPVRRAFKLNTRYNRSPLTYVCFTLFCMYSSRSNHINN